MVRPARRDDGPAILSLMTRLAEFERLAGPDPAAGQRLLEDAFDRRLLELFVAERDGAVAAYAACFTTYSTFLARPTLFLEDLFVDPGSRRHGVARAVLAYLRALAAERGCGRFEWMVLDWNRDAQALYDAVGARRLDEWRLCRVDL